MPVAQLDGQFALPPAPQYPQDVENGDPHAGLDLKQAQSRCKPAIVTR
jgi:hypothetical protein